MILNYIQQIRFYELDVLRPYLYTILGKNILEIGAGAGWQAKALSNEGYNVEAIDIKGSSYEDFRVFEIKEYDGNHLPYPDSSFDIVFTSHFLFYKINNHDFQKEIWRVLCPNGRVINIVPSGSIAFWNILCHYLYVVKIFVLSFKDKNNVDLNLTRIFEKASKSNFKTKFIKALIPYSFIPQINFIYQFYYFSRLHWLPFFKQNGWDVEKKIPTKCFHTGYSLLGFHLNILIRRVLSIFLGSSSIIYILKKSENEK